MRSVCMKRCYYIGIVILLIKSSFIYSQNIYQSKYYTSPPGKAIIDIKSIDVPKDISKKRIAKLSDDKRVILLKNLGLAREYLYQNDILNVYEALDKSDAILNDLPESFYIRALAHWKIHDISFARYYFLKALSVGTEDYKIYTDAIKFFEEIGLPEEALRISLHAYKRSDDSSWLFEGGNLILDFYEASANYYFALLAKSSYDAFGIEGISDIASKNSNYSLALNGYNAALIEYKKSKYKKTKLYTNNINRVTKKMNLAKLDVHIDGWQQKFENGEFQTALSILKDISKTTEVENRLYLLNAKTYFEMGQYKQAQTLIEYSIAKDSSLEESYILKAQIEINQGQLNRAIKTLEGGFVYNYDKTTLYNSFLGVLKIGGSKYYYNNILLELSKISQPDYKQSIFLIEYYLEKQEYQKAREILLNIKEKTKEIDLLNKKIDNIILLHKSEENGKKGNYKEILKDLYGKTFDGNEEDLRIRLLANALYNLNDLGQAIEILSLKIDDSTLSLNNTYFLLYLININKQKNTTEITEEFIVKIKNWQEHLFSNIIHLKKKISEFLEFGQYNDAINYLESIKGTSKYSDVAINNLESQVYAEFAGKLYDEKKIKDAQNSVNISLSKNKDNIDAVYIQDLLDMYYKWGDIEDYLYEDDYKITISMATDFLSILPANINIRMMLIRALALERNIQSIEIMKKINNMDVYNHQKLSILSDIYYGFGMYDYCLDLYKKSLDEDFNLHTAIMYTHTLDKLGKTNDALKFALDITIRYPKNSYGYYLSSQLYLKKNNTEVAFDLIKTAISIRNNIKYQLQLGLYYEKINDWEKAFEIYTSILNEKKYYIDVYVHMIKILLEEKKDANQAKTLAETLVNIDTQNPYSYYLLANACYELGIRNDILNTDKIHYLKSSKMFYQNAIYRTIYGKDTELRYIIKEKIKLLDKRISDIERRK